VSAVADDLRQDLYTTVDEGDEAELRNWSAAGFTVLRREHHYLVPTAPDRTRLAGAVLPAGMSLLSADAVDEYGLRLLDEALRHDVPGTDGWINDPQEFREQTFDERRFDPATYLVAVDDVSQAFAGLARVWRHPRQPRLGLVGVTSGYRRRGLAKMLLAAVFAPLCDRGISEVAAEADAADAASNALLSRIGARRVGGSVELVRRAAWCPDLGCAFGDHWWHLRRSPGWRSYAGPIRAAAEACSRRSRPGVTLFEVGDERWGQPVAVGSCGSPAVGGP
jgi:RimJ/RimL family protein N-acetyltransferase